MTTTILLSGDVQLNPGPNKQTEFITVEAAGDVQVADELDECQGPALSAAPCFSMGIDMGRGNLSSLISRSSDVELDPVNIITMKLQQPTKRKLLNPAIIKRKKWKFVQTVNQA